MRLEREIMSKCQVKYCRDESSVLYYGKEVCEKHWQKHCDDTKRFNLKKEFNIKEKEEING